MNKWLKGNGYWCPDCSGSGRGKALDRIDYSDGTYCQFYAVCPTCKGEKRTAAPADDVIAERIPMTQPPVRHSCFSECIEHGLCVERGLESA